MDFLPSKKFVYALGGVIALAFFFIVLSQWGLGNRSPYAQLTARSDSLIPAISEFSTSTLANPTLMYAGEGSNGSLTAGIGKKLITELSTLQMQKGTVTPEDILQVAHTAADPLNAQINAQHFVRDDFYLFAEAKPGAKYVKEYANLFTGITAHYRETLALDEVDIFATAKQNKDPSSLVPLEARAQAFRDYAEAMRHLPALKPIFEDHMALVNSSWALAEDIDNIRKGFDDPMRSLLAINAFVEHANARRAAFEKIAEYIKQSGVTFDKSEAGYYLFNK